MAETTTTTVPIEQLIDKFCHCPKCGSVAGVEKGRNWVGPRMVIVHCCCGTVPYSVYERVREAPTPAAMAPAQSCPSHV